MNFQIEKIQRPSPYINNGAYCKILILDCDQVVSIGDAINQIVQTITIKKKLPVQYDALFESIDFELNYEFNNNGDEYTANLKFDLPYNSPATQNKIETMLRKPIGIIAKDRQGRNRLIVHDDWALLRLVKKTEKRNPDSISLEFEGKWHHAPYYLDENFKFLFQYSPIISLDNNTILENKTIGTYIGALSFTVGGDDLTNDVVFSLKSGISDNTKFYLDGNWLRNNFVFDYETKNSYTITIVVSAEGIYEEKIFTINIVDAAEGIGDMIIEDTFIIS